MGGAIVVFFREHHGFHLATRIKSPRGVFPCGLGLSTVREINRTNSSFLPSVLLAWRNAFPCADAAGMLATCIKSTRSAAKVWSRHFRAPPYIIPNCKFVIQLFDTFEEDRGLSPAEMQRRSRKQSSGNSRRRCQHCFISIMLMHRCA